MNAPRSFRLSIASPRGAAAFTLIELLVSIVVLTLLTLALFNVLNATTTGWNRTEQRADSYREARAALDVITHDLQTMVKSADFDFLAQTEGPRQGTIIFPSEEERKYKTPSSVGDALFFYSLQPRDAQDSTTAVLVSPDFKKNRTFLCQLGFYLHYAADGSGRSTYTLRRRLRSSGETWVNRGELVKIEADFEAAANPGPGVFRFQSRAGRDLDCPPDEVLARNVVDFKLVFFYADANGNITTTPPTGTGVNLRRTMPVMIEVKLLALNESTAAVLAARGRAAWEDNSYQGPNSVPSIPNPTAIQKLRYAGGQLFTTRIYLRRQ